jgi:hypothetical protein
MYQKIDKACSRIKFKFISPKINNKICFQFQSKEEKLAKLCFIYLMSIMKHETFELFNIIISKL